MLSSLRRSIVPGQRYFSTIVNGISGNKYPFVLRELPYAKTALEPVISVETLDFHYGKHHQTYVTNLNNFAKDSDELKSKTLLDIILTAAEGTPLYNNAAQVWNHDFYWQSMRSPVQDNLPNGNVAEFIKRDFGEFDTFKTKFNSAAASHFGSGWVWLVLNKQGKLEIVQTHDGGNPIREEKGTPLLTCDVWEHAYYIDFRNARPKYLESWWSCVNWDFANSHM